MIYEYDGWILLNLYCTCGRKLPLAPPIHLHKCECGKLWIKADCSDECLDWQEI